MTEQTQSTATQPSDAIPQGFEQMSPLDMNAIGFDRKHTVLTPEIMSKLGEVNNNA